MDRGKNLSFVLALASTGFVPGAGIAMLEE